MKGTTKNIRSQKGGFLNYLRLIILLMTVALPLMKNALISLTKSILVPLVLAAAASTADASIH